MSSPPFVVTPMFTVVIPTIGRPTLARTIASIRSQSYCANAEIIVVADVHGMEPKTLGMIRDVGLEYGASAVTFDAGAHDTGSPQLHLGYMHARGDWALNVGDDDVYEPGAFEAMAAVISQQPERMPLMCKVLLFPNDQRGNHRPVTLWEERSIERFKVTGQSFVCPNDPRRMGRWVDDVTFMRETVALWGGRVEWRDELIARCY